MYHSLQSTQRSFTCPDFFYFFFSAQYEEVGKADLSRDCTEEGDLSVSF